MVINRPIAARARGPILKVARARSPGLFVQHASSAPGRTNLRSSACIYSRSSSSSPPFSRPRPWDFTSVYAPGRFRVFFGVRVRVCANTLIISRAGKRFIGGKVIREFIRVGIRCARGRGGAARWGFSRGRWKLSIRDAMYFGFFLASWLTCKHKPGVTFILALMISSGALIKLGYRYFFLMNVFVISRSSIFLGHLFFSIYFTFLIYKLFYMVLIWFIDLFKSVPLWLLDRDFESTNIFD